MPETKRLLWLGAGAGVLAWLLLGDQEAEGVLGDVRQIFRDAVNGITKGRRLTNCPYDKTTGIVPCPPEQLAAQAGLDLETYALARVIASEEGNSTTATQALVAHAINNAARESGKTIASKLLWAKLEAHRGRFGTQRNIEKGTDGYNGSDRFASTAADPYEGHMMVAVGVRDGTIPDLTGGADQFDRPSGESDPDRVAANREASGSTLVSGLEDLIGNDLRFWDRSN